jgi:hypothetical protein
MGKKENGTIKECGYGKIEKEHNEECQRAA